MTTFVCLSGALAGALAAMFFIAGITIGIFWERWSHKH